MGLVSLIANQWKDIMKNIIIISPHPDDEAIGCGGTIINHVNEGDYVEVVFLTSGEKGGHGPSEEETSKIREQEAMDAANILKLSKIEFWRQPDGKLEATSANVKRLKDKIQELKTNVIYVTHDDEQHPDHRAAARLVRQSISELNGDIKIPIVWMYEVWTPIQNIDHIVDFTSYVDIKRKAI